MPKEESLESSARAPNQSVAVGPAWVGDPLLLAISVLVRSASMQNVLSLMVGRLGSLDKLPDRLPD